MKKVSVLFICMLLCMCSTINVYSQTVKEEPIFFLKNFVEEHLNNALKYMELDKENMKKIDEVTPDENDIYEEIIIYEDENINNEELYFQKSYMDNIEHDYENADLDFHYLCQMVRIELGTGSGEEFYNACYLQTAVALNRIIMGWGNSIQEVLFQPGQFYGYGYECWDWSSIDYSCPALMQAVYDCLNCNSTPSNLIFADSRHNYGGTETMDYYTTLCGQDFYLAK